MYILFAPFHLQQAPRVFDTVSWLGYIFGALGLGSPPRHGPATGAPGSAPDFYAMTKTNMVPIHVAIHFELTGHAYHNGVMEPCERILVCNPCYCGHQQLKLVLIDTSFLCFCLPAATLNHATGVQHALNCTRGT